jgi:vacuolar protein sorting-associated protein VTA1
VLLVLQCGECSLQQVARKIKYVKFHAARILKALKEGTDLNPPAPEPETQAPLPPQPTVEEVADESITAVSFDLAPQLAGPSLHDDSIQAAPRHDSIPEVHIPDAPMTFSSPIQQAPSSPPQSSRFLPPSLSQEPVSPPEISSAPSHTGYFPPVPKVHEPSPGLSPITLGSTNTMLPDMGCEHTYRSPSPPISLLPSVSSYQPTHSTPQPVRYQQQVNTHILQPPVARKELKQEDIVQAQKYAKWAISALDYEDVDNAILQFRSALASLGATP